MAEYSYTVVDELEASGELENTYIVFASDNGYHLGTHRLKRGKKTPYEDTASVPLFIRGPGMTAGSMVDELVLNTDLASTFATSASSMRTAKRSSTTWRTAPTNSTTSTRALTLP